MVMIDDDDDSVMNVLLHDWYASFCVYIIKIPTTRIVILMGFVQDVLESLGII